MNLQLLPTSALLATVAGVLRNICFQTAVFVLFERFGTAKNYHLKNKICKLKFVIYYLTFYKKTIFHPIFTQDFFLHLFPIHLR